MLGLGAALGIGIGSNLLGNMIGSMNQASANNANIKIAKMNNEFNERMLQKQMDYNLEMWNKQNEYNTASNQRQRLEEAGLNPYMMMNGGSAGQASNAGGVNPPTATPVTMQAYRPDFTGVAQAAQSYIQFKQQQELNAANIAKSNEETRAIKLENDNFIAKRDIELAILRKQSNNLDIRNTIDQMISDNWMTKFNSDMALANRQLALFDQQIEAEKIEVAMKSLELQYLPEQLKLGLAQQIADIDLTKKTAKTEVQKALKTSYEAAGIKLTNDNLEKMSDDIIRQMELKTSQDEVNLQDSFWREKVNEYNARGSLGKGGRFIHSVGQVGSALFPYFTAGGLFQIGNRIGSPSGVIDRSTANRMLGK